MCVRVHFLRWSKSILKTEVEKLDDSLRLAITNIGSSGVGAGVQVHPNSFDLPKFEQNLKKLGKKVSTFSNKNNKIMLPCY